MRRGLPYKCITLALRLHYVLHSSLMLEKTPKTFNARFEKEVHFQIADLLGRKYGRDKTEVVARAIQEAWARGSEEVAVSQLGGSRAAPEPALTGRGPALERGFPVQCRHCGNQARGATKFATICFDCKGSGHSNDPRDCPVCTAGSAI